MKTQKISTKKMALTAVLLAMATALSMVKIITMPLGGSVTLLSMLPIAMIAIYYGTGWGLTSAFIYSLIQLALDLAAVLSWGLTPMALIGCLLFDYIVAFTPIGLSGLFSKKGIKGICAGVFVALFLRLLSHFISGAFIFDIWCPEGWSPIPYSIAYNGAYMLPEIVFTMVGASVLFKLPQIQKLMNDK